MYRLETATRLPVVDADGQPVPDDRVLLSEITVLPALTPTSIPAGAYSLYLPFMMNEQ